MAKGRTLWEMFTGLFDTTADVKFFNPLQAKPGSGFKIDLIDWRDRDFRLHEIREYKRRIEGREFLFADYVLVDRPLHDQPVWVRLRVNPADPASSGGLTHHALLLRLEEDMAYDKGLHDVVQAETRVFEINHDDGSPTETFTRLNDVSDSYIAQVTVVQDKNADAKIDIKELQRLKVEYWDYGREWSDAAGQPTTEYLFVEMNADTGWFQIWRGEEVDPHRVVVL
jgi:hypothetical protein